MSIAYALYAKASLQSELTSAVRELLQSLDYNHGERQVECSGAALVGYLLRPRVTDNTAKFCILLGGPRVVLTVHLGIASTATLRPLRSPVTACSLYPAQ